MKVIIKFFIIAASLMFFSLSSYAKGEYVEVNGLQIYLQVLGQGSPTVVLISGLGGHIDGWNKVIPQVSQFAKVVVYDRPGMGKSQACTSCEMITANDNVIILKKMLEAANIKPPYVLVGHSLGGLFAQLYASRYPNDVSGVVLVDSTNRNQINTVVIPLKTTDYYKEAIGFNESLKQVQQAKTFPNIPLIVLTATKHKKRINEAAWQQWQKQLVMLSPQGVQIMAWGVGHNIAGEQPQLVIDAISTIINRG